MIEEKQWLFQVTDVKNGRQMVLRPDVAESKVPAGETQSVYYAHIDPPKYYLDMLALYLHNFLLAYSPITTETVDKIDMQGLILQRSERAISKPFPPKASLLRKSNLSLQHIYQYIAYFYLRLSDHSNPDSYYGGDQSNRDFEQIMRAVKREAEDLLNKVETYIGVDEDFYENRPPKEEELKKVMGDSKIREIKEDFNKLKKSPLDIQDMMRRL